jgi:hypothetical protein
MQAKNSSLRLAHGCVIIEADSQRMVFLTVRDVL